MDMKPVLEKGIEQIKKFRYPLLILLVGVALMCWPSRSNNTTEAIPQVTVPDRNDTAFLQAEDLEAILRQVHGAGEVKVLLSRASGEVTVYHQDENTSQSDSGSTIKKETVLTSDAQRNESAFVSQVLGPSYLGAIVLCSGADQPAVKLAIVEAVSKVTGLGSDDICVLKLK